MIQSIFNLQNLPIDCQNEILKKVSNPGTVSIICKAFKKSIEEYWYKNANTQILQAFPRLKIVTKDQKQYFKYLMAHLHIEAEKYNCNSKPHPNLIGLALLDWEASIYTALITKIKQKQIAYENISARIKIKRESFEEKLSFIPNVNRFLHRRTGSLQCDEILIVGEPT